MLPQDLGRVVETDVLIIGGGIAGLFAAIKAKEGNPGAKVTLVDKACPGASGCSAFAAGVFLYCQPGDDTEPLVRQIVEDNAEYLIDQDYVRIAAAESYDRFRDLQEFGVEFLKDRRGQITRVPALAAKTGLCSPFGGGPHLMWKMRAEALKRGVVMFDRFMTTDLLTDNGGCIGAVGFGVRDGEFYIFKGRATVLAGGNLLFNAAPMGSSGGTGDGIAIAFRAGLELRNMEQLGNVSVGPKSLSAPGLHVIFGNGGILVNAQGERFMERYNPVLKEEARRFETARAILSEWREGRGPCYLDCTHLSPEAIATIKRSLPLVM
ncbi:MAG: FAD-binding protein, partial [Dehalococcoidia bacterium]|nr:FAD-binding protein [Dehalococcoidia bacterium]